MPKDTDTAALEQSLMKATGYKVNIAFDGTGGTISIAYGGRAVIIPAHQRGS